MDPIPPLIRHALRGILPWHIDYDRLEEDWVYRLHGSMKLHAAKILARELRDAVWQAHETALGGVISKAVPRLIGRRWRGCGSTGHDLVTAAHRGPERAGLARPVLRRRLDPWPVLATIGERWREIQVSVKAE